MKILKFIRDFLTVFLLVFVISAIVSYAYSLIVHGNGIFDWESAIRLGIIFGIIFPAAGMMRGKQHDWRKLITAKTSAVVILKYFINAVKIVAFYGSTNDFTPFRKLQFRHSQ